MASKKNRGRPPLAHLSPGIWLRLDLSVDAELRRRAHDGGRQLGEEIRRTLRTALKIPQKPAKI